MMTDATCHLASGHFTLVLVFWITFEETALIGLQIFARGTSTFETCFGVFFENHIYIVQIYSLSNTIVFK